MNKKSSIYIATIVVTLSLVVSASIFILSNQTRSFVRRKHVFLEEEIDKTNSFFESLGPQYIPNDYTNYTGPYAQEIPILMYHDVIPEPGQEYDGNKIVVDAFREQMEYLVANNFYTITLDEFDAFYQGELELPKNSIMLTFDDGFNGMLHLVEPILIEYNLHAISFIIGEKTMNEPLYFLEKSQIEEMTARGFFDFESHSYGMHAWSDKSRGMIEDASSDEVNADKKMQEEIFGPTMFFCYPFGHSDGTAAEVLGANGYKYAVTTAGGYASRQTPALQLPRIRINGDTSIERYAKIIET